MSPIRSDLRLGRCDRGTGPAFGDLTLSKTDASWVFEVHAPLANSSAPRSNR